MPAERLTDARLAEIIEDHFEVKPVGAFLAFPQQSHCNECDEWWPCEIALLATEISLLRAKEVVK